jgi:toxin ParE1/3/4
LTSHEVALTRDAERDLEDIYRYIAQHDAQSSADRVLERLIETAAALGTHPDRGSCPQELRTVGIEEYRQVFFKPYRLIYRLHGQRVVIYVIADGRRDMQSLLARRLFSP